MSSASDNSGAAVGSFKRHDSKSNPESHVITIKEIIDGSKKTKSKSAAVIQKVPEELRKLKESAYTPRFVSIGPLHSNNDHLKKRMQNIKMSYVNDLFGRMAEFGKEEKAQVLKRCQDEMRKLTGEARKYYAENGDLLTEDMLAIDGCFVLELLYRKRKYETTKNPHGDDPIYGSGLLRDGVQIDLLLVENQLPFFVLEKLFVFTEKARSNPYLEFGFNSIQDYVLSYFHNVMLLDQDEEFKPSGRSESTAKKRSFHHILHLLHEHFIPQNSNKEQGGKIVFMKTAQDLDFAGVKFVPRPRNYPFQVDFKEPKGFRYLFHRASFEIPTLNVDNSTEPVLRNLIAFEQCTPHAPSFVTSYAYLMDRLVSTAKDVKVLIEAEVLVNYLAADEEVSDLFNKLCKEVVLGDFYFAETCQKAADYSKLGWPEFIGYMRRNYFAKPWMFTAFLVAFLVFGMTVGTFIRNLLR
ncbi:putative UPF0481 protein At3g02645 [Diospyros lotus]|uniref:putative UPF0481 protein At3g02645 n=1 Tax=Diospyros lotus TaxID=55363 RepID=UPI00225811AA|nr:putative UPF0481 protein At3g02645 [Diospyros lotus]